ncbi:MAG: DUF5676 family membrane protein [Nanoarchaeota archaeon]
MRFNINGIGLASGITFSIIYVVCAVISAAFPNGALKFFNLFAHSVDLTKLTGKSFTFGSFIAGLILTFIAAYLAGVIFAYVYNLFDKR